MGPQRSHLTEVLWYIWFSVTLKTSSIVFSAITLIGMDTKLKNKEKKWFVGETDSRICGTLTL